MDSMDNVRERVEALEQRTEHLHQHIRIVARRLPWWRGIACGVLLLSLVSLAPLSQAADFACAAGNVGCLIDAINQANANGEVNTLTLEAGTYTLTVVDNNTNGPNGLPSVTSTLTINGSKADSTVIMRDASVPEFRIVHVATTGILTLRGVTITGGKISQGTGRGGGIFNAGTLTLIATIITNNTVNDNGGGIENDNSTVIIRRSRIVTNTSTLGAGGIGSIGGTVTIHKSVIAGNTSRVAGGGISIGPGSAGLANTLIITNSRISDNTTGTSTTNSRGGGIISGGKLIISKSTISGNVSSGGRGVGGGISGLETWEITDSSIYGNAASDFGGGIENAGATGVIVNSTVSNNTSNSGGGVGNGQGVVLLINSTLANNSAQDGGGIDSIAATTLLQNTILALNTAQTGPDCANPLTSLDNNLIGDPTGCTISLLPHDLTGDPGLDIFTDNGKPGHGHFPLLPTSQAIDAGNDDVCPRTDQLGQRRIGRCDIGAIRFLDHTDVRRHDKDPATATQASQ
jgi:hypothetical protein